MYRDRDQRDFARQLRKKPTEAENRLWQRLRGKQLGVKFRQQAAIGTYFVDFVCFSHCLIVELDGPQHLDEAARKYDEQRDQWLASQGFHILRFRNQKLDDEIDQVVASIKLALQAPLPNPPRT